MSTDDKGPRPKWQRARFLDTAIIIALRGREVWCECGPPFSSFDRSGEFGTGYRSNVIYSDGRRMWPTWDNVELLARNPADFADEVALVAYETWLAEAGGEGKRQ